MRRIDFTSLGLKVKAGTTGKFTFQVSEQTHGWNTHIGFITMTGTWPEVKEKVEPWIRENTGDCELILVTLHTVEVTG